MSEAGMCYSVRPVSLDIWSQEVLDDVFVIGLLGLVP